MVTNPEAALLLFLPTRRELSRGGAAYEAGYRKLIAKNVRLLSEFALPLVLVCDEAPRWARTFALDLLEHQLHFLPLVGATQEARQQAALRGATRLGFERLLLVWSGAINLQPRELRRALASLEASRVSCGLTQHRRPYLLAGSAAQLASFSPTTSRIVPLSAALFFGADTRLSFAFREALSRAELRLAVVLSSLLRVTDARPPEASPIEKDARGARVLARSPPR